MNSSPISTPEHFSPTHILVTGGCGFIGSNYIHYLMNTDNKIHITNLDLLTYAALPESLELFTNNSNYRFIEGDICDGDLVTGLLQSTEGGTELPKIDTIVHFAAESHVDRSITGPATFIQTNLVGTFTLLEAARNVWLNEQKLTASKCRFHHISTDEVYGTLTKSDPPFLESTRYAPNSPYSASKAGSDHLVRAYFHTYGLPVTTSNCSNNYGPHQHGEKFIPTVIRKCLAQQPIPIYGDGSNIRDWLYVLDHCQGIDTVMRTGTLGETYNIGGNNEWTNLNIAKKICASMDKRFPTHAPHHQLLQFVNDRPGHDWRYAINCQKIKDKLSFLPQVDFDSGIEKTIDYYLTH